MSGLRSVAVSGDFWWSPGHQADDGVSVPLSLPFLLSPQCYWHCSQRWLQFVTMTLQFLIAPLDARKKKLKEVVLAKEQREIFQSLLTARVCVFICLYIYRGVYFQSHRSLGGNRGITWSGNLTIRSHVWFPRTTDSMDMDRKFWQPDKERQYTINVVVFFSRSWGRNCETEFWSSNQRILWGWEYYTTNTKRQ